MLTERPWSCGFHRKSAKKSSLRLKTTNADCERLRLRSTRASAVAVQITAGPTRSQHASIFERLRSSGPSTQHWTVKALSSMVTATRG